jgi:hypothetical protein
LNRTEIINSLILNNNFKTYLEIGVRNLDDNFNKIVEESNPDSTSLDYLKKLVLL